MKKPKILVVEDEKVVATDIEESLQKLGYTVVAGAASGIGAIRKAVETDPDLVLMDIKLKGDIDGVDAAGELHDRLGIPVVFLTAYADGEILDRAKRTSPSGYVLKPFDERALRSAVEIALHQHPKEQRLVESERRLVSALRSIDEGVLMTRSDGTVTLTNRAAERLTGWKQRDAIGKRISDIFTSVDGASGSLMADPISRVIREGVSISLGEHRVLVSRHGAETWIRGNGVPLRDEDGEIVGAALVFHAAEVRSG
ncbi:MAG: response regulator, partial [bacterium]|nr:response regulator [bacterium]